jgi:hypothetical protein
MATFCLRMKSSQRAMNMGHRENNVIPDNNSKKFLG